MAGEAGAHPPSFLAHQSPLFQQEFPKLSSSDGQNVQTGQKSGADTQYGPGPSLRPQSRFLLTSIILLFPQYKFNMVEFYILAEGSWIQGGRSQTGGSGGSQSLVQGPLPHHPGVEHAGGRNNLGPHPPPGVAMGPGGPALGISGNGPPMHGPPLHLPPGASPPQFRAIPPSLVRSNNKSERIVSRLRIMNRLQNYNLCIL